MTDKVKQKMKNIILKSWMLKSFARKPVPITEICLKFGFIITEYEKQYCPRCGSVLNAGPNYQPGYCSHCGQKLNFSGIQWKAEKEIGFTGRTENFEPVKN